MSARCWRCCVQSFFSLDEFSGLIVHEFTLKTYARAASGPANFDIILRTVRWRRGHAGLRRSSPFPIAYYAARYARGRMKALFYLAVMLPLWSSYLVKVYAWKLILAKEGILNWAVDGICTWPGCSNAVLALPVIGGNSLSVSYIGTFLVFVYIWLPFMILPMQAALERVPRNLLEASADLGARPGQTFRTRDPAARAARHHRRLDLHLLADARRLHHPAHRRHLAPLHRAGGLQHQGTAGNIPLAAAFTVVPIVIMGVYLWMAKRMGAFDAL